MSCSDPSPRPEEQRLRQLRLRAEKALARSEEAAAPMLEAARLEVGTLFEELRIYQAELEIQNQELSAAQQRAEALRDRFTRLFAALPLPALVVDDRGLVREANAEARRLFGITGRAGVRSVHRLLSNRDDPALGRLMEAARVAGNARQSSPNIGFLTSESEDHRFLVHAIGVQEDGEDPLVELLLVDQTGPERVERQRAALAREVERFERAQQASGVGTWEWDVARDRIAWDAAARALLDLPPERASFDNAAWQAMVHPEDLPGILARYATNAATNDRFQNIARYRHADGRWRWLRATGRVLSRDEAGQPLRLAGVVRNIDAEVQARDAASAATARLQLACDIADIGIWNWDLADGRLEWDARMLRWYEVPQSVLDDGLVYAFWRDRVDPADIERSERTLAGSLAGGSPGGEMEFRVVLPGGRVRVIQSAWQIVRSPDGTAQHVVGVNRDITALRDSEAALIAAKEAAEAADAAKGRFLANVSHEIRTPLNAMLGLAAVLLEDGLTPRQYDRVEKIRAAGTVLLETLNDILDQSKIEAGGMRIESEPLRIDSILNRCRDLFSVQAESNGIALSFARATDLPEVLLGDPLRLQQALGNLVGNAMKFTEHGEVRVRAVCVARDDETVTLRMSVTDTGVGLAPDQLERLFSPFQQGDASISRRYGGTGLGLSIVKRLAELMGGKAGAQSAPGEGSTFWFTARLRIADAGVAPPTDPPPPDPKPQSADGNPGAAPSRTVDFASLAPLLRDLERQVWERRVRARDTAARITGMLEGTRLQVDWSVVEGALARFDFNEAQRRLRALATEEGWTLT